MGKFRQGIPGDSIINVTIDHRWPVRQFDGEKHIVLSTMSWMGGKNLFLGVAYLVLGGLLELAAMFFVCIRVLHPRKLGDPRSCTGRSPRSGDRRRRRRRAVARV